MNDSAASLTDRVAARVSLKRRTKLRCPKLAPHQWRLHRGVGVLRLVSVLGLVTLGFIGVDSASANAASAGPSTTSCGTWNVVPSGGIHLTYGELSGVAALSSNDIMGRRLRVRGQHHALEWHPLESGCGIRGFH